jgi:hypothetical protein
MEVIDHSDQKYDTLGDYWTDPDGTWQFRVSDLGDWRYNYSVLLHEFIEFALIQQHGVLEGQVLEFDLNVPSNSPYANDPGFDPGAPYHTEHVFADCVERLIAPQLGMRISDPWLAADKLPKWLKK